MKGKSRNLLLGVIACAFLSACQTGGTSVASSADVTSEKGSSTVSETGLPLTSSEEEGPSSSEKSSDASSMVSSMQSLPSESSEASMVDSSEGASSIASSKEESSIEESMSEIISPCLSDEHSFVDRIAKKATIIEKGVIRHECENCGVYTEESYYDLEEYSFEDMTYCYDGKPHKILIEGMLPYGVHAVYENNVLTDIGTQEASVSLYDESDVLLETKTANISVVENVGFANLRLTTSTGEDPDYKEHDAYVTMNVTIDNCAEKYALNEVPGGIRVRGNSTNQDEVTKRAWRLKFDKKQNLLGLNGGAKEKSWVLLADYFDQSLLRNATAFNMGNSLFNHSKNYCSDFQHVNFYMNGDYRGVYLLAEQQQAKASRIPVAEAEEDYKGTDVGYLIELDGLASSEDYYFTVGSGGSKAGGYPSGGGGGDSVNGVSIPSKSYALKTDVYGDQQLPFIEHYFSNVFEILKNAAKREDLQVLDENNDLIPSPYETAYETLDSVIDMESLFKTFVLQEYMRNYDVGWGSFFFFVDFSEGAAHPKLTFGAPWDFDWSTGNPNNGAVNSPTGRFCLTGNHSLFNPWLYLLSQTDFFEEMFPKYYSVFAHSDIYERAVEFIDYESTAFASEFDANFERWGTLNGQKPTMYTRTDVVKNFTCHRDAADFLLDWMRQRKEYMDGKYLLPAE